MGSKAPFQENPLIWCLCLPLFRREAGFPYGQTRYPDFWVLLFVIVVESLNLYGGLWLICLLLFMCILTLDKGSFSNLAIRTQSS